MKEKPILFSDEMVRAILQGLKTQTRRIVKPQPIWKEFESGQNGWWRAIGGINQSVWDCPYKVGQILWVREAWYQDKTGNVYYRSTYNGEVKPSWNYNFSASWKPSIHMRREISRINLEIVSVRVQRIQDITVQDIHAEGIPYHTPYCSRGIEPSRATCSCASYQCVYTDRPSMGRDFKTLWDKINEKRGFGWDVNPWVWCIEFKRRI